MNSLLVFFDKNLARYFVKRIIYFIPTMILIIILGFAFSRILPGNPALMRVGKFATHEALEKMERSMGLDKPLIYQFFDYVFGLLNGDLGTSWITGHSVTEDIIQRLPATFELAGMAMLFALLIGIPLGVAAAVKKDTIFDHLGRLLGVIGLSVPLFWMGIVLILIFFYILSWAPPPLGRIAIEVSPPLNITGLYTVDSLLTFNFPALWSSIQYLFLPTVALGFSVMATIFRIVRSSMLEALDSDYILAAKAAGIPKRTLYFNDALRNSLVPLLTQIGLVLGYLLGGNVIVEGLFAWPGMGGYVWNAVASKDLDAIQGFILVAATILALISLLVDLLYAIVDPRVRIE